MHHPTISNSPLAMSSSDQPHFCSLTKQLGPNWTLAASASDVGSQISNRSCHLRLCSWTRRSFSIRSNIWVMCSSNSSDLAGRWWTLQVGFYLRTFYPIIRLDWLWLYQIYLSNHAISFSSSLLCFTISLHHPWPPIYFQHHSQTSWPIPGLMLSTCCRISNWFGSLIRVVTK